jgi:ABC-type phosphate transport system substrate-binding protein
MKHSLFSRVVAAAALALAALVAHADHVFVAHPDVATDRLTASEARAILDGSQVRFPGGPVIKLAVLSEGAVHESVVSTYTGRNADQFDKWWKRQVFTGKAVMPAVFKTEDELVAYVARTPNALGYVGRDHAAPGTKKLSVE